MASIDPCPQPTENPAVAKRYLLEPPSSKVAELRGWAVLLALLAASSTWPALHYGSLAVGPDWVRWVLLLATVQLIYVLWMMATCDWSAVLTVGIVYAAVCVLYGAAGYLAATTPETRPLPLGLDSVRWAAARWSLAVSLLTGVCAAGSFRMASRWRRQWRLQARLFYDADNPP